MFSFKVNLKSGFLCKISLVLNSGNNFQNMCAYVHTYTYTRIHVYWHTHTYIGPFCSQTKRFLLRPYIMLQLHSSLLDLDTGFQILTT